MSRTQHTARERAKSFVSLQNRRYEKVHAEPWELKSLAIELGESKAPEQTLYVHPSLLRIPMFECPKMQRATPAQVGLISRYRYATNYLNIAINELQVVSANMAIANGCFSRESEEFRLLFQESSEEFDHIWSFLHTHSRLSEDFAGRDPGQLSRSYFGDKGGESLRGMIHQLGLVTILKSSEWVSTKLPYLLGRRLNGELGTGCFWLLRRYLGNVILKSFEAFAHHPWDDRTYHPLAVKLTKEHRSDEARHMTTSLELGMQMFEMAHPTCRRLLRRLMGVILKQYVQSSIASLNERWKASMNGSMGGSYLDVLRFLRELGSHPELADLFSQPRDLVSDWVDRGYGIDEDLVTRKRAKFFVTQVGTLADRLGINLEAQLSPRARQRYLAFQG